MRSRKKRKKRKRRNKESTALIRNQRKHLRLSYGVEALADPSFLSPNAVSSTCINRLSVGTNELS